MALLDPCGFRGQANLVTARDFVVLSQTTPRVSKRLSAEGCRAKSLKQGPEVVAQQIDEVRARNNVRIGRPSVIFPRVLPGPQPCLYLLRPSRNTLEVGRRPPGRILRLSRLSRLGQYLSSVGDTPLTVLLSVVLAAQRVPAEVCTAQGFVPYLTRHGVLERKLEGVHVRRRPR